MFSSPAAYSSLLLYYFFILFHSLLVVMAIFESYCKSCVYRIGPEARTIIQTTLQKAYDVRDKTFGNARFARNLFEKIVENQANRVVGLPGADQSALMMIQPEDIPAPGKASIA